jgi:hypothetical protein
VLEFWLIDARGEDLEFLLQTRGPAGFIAAERDADGYQRSHVLDAWYFLDRSRHQRGHWVYRLRMR